MGILTESDMPAPSALNWSASCMASSLHMRCLLPSTWRNVLLQRRKRNPDNLLLKCIRQQACFHSNNSVWQQVASHLVGVRTSAKTPKGSAASFCRIGRAKAAVFPLPV